MPTMPFEGFDSTYLPEVGRPHLGPGYSELTRRIEQLTEDGNSRVLPKRNNDQNMLQ
jgi:hypothetical protein